MKSLKGDTALSIAQKKLAHAEGQIIEIKEVFTYIDPTPFQKGLMRFVPKEIDKYQEKIDRIKPIVKLLESAAQKQSLPDISETSKFNLFEEQNNSNNSNNALEFDSSTAKNNMWGRQALFDLWDK